MCHANERVKAAIKPEIKVMRDLNSNLVAMDRAHAGKYKEVTTIGNAELWWGLNKNNKYLKHEYVLYEKTGKVTL